MEELNVRENKAFDEPAEHQEGGGRDKILFEKQSSGEDIGLTNP
ncbi:MAG: hypothetical protein ACT4OY_05695 [Alphaproteobacteria bacterium]